MNQTNPFVISKFTNPSGEIVFRVAGWLEGKRVRRNFPTRLEAETERQVLQVQQIQRESGVRVAATRLSDEQLHEAESAFRRLKDAPQSLMTYLECGLANYRSPQEQKPLTAALAEYLAVKTTETERTLLSGRQLRSIRNELSAFQRRFPSGALSGITPAQLVPYLERGKPSLKTYNNRRGLLSTFFKFCLQRDWISKNPIEKTPHHRINHRRGSAKTITAEQAATLMAFVESYEGGEMVPYFAICLFAGIRPCVRYGEITKLQPGSVKLETGVIHIEPDVSKVRMKRLVTIQPNLAAWLQAYPLRAFRLIPPNAVNMHRKICDRFDLSHDILRHTFISMFVAKYRSMGEAALQAGNSESIIRKHYLDLKSTEEADEFFGILPVHAGLAASAVRLDAPSGALLPEVMRKEAAA